MRLVIGTAGMYPDLAAYYLEPYSLIYLSQVCYQLGEVIASETMCTVAYRKL